MRLFVFMNHLPGWATGRIRQWRAGPLRHSSTHGRVVATSRPSRHAGRTGDGGSDPRAGAGNGEAGDARPRAGHVPRAGRERRTRARGTGSGRPVRRIYYGISAEAITKVRTSDLPFDEGVQALEQADRNAVEQALAVALEFPVEPQDEDEDDDAPEDFEVEEAADWVTESR